MHSTADQSRPWTFYALAAFFTLFVLFLYGPMIVIYVLSFQGPNGGLTFPLQGVSLHWFDALIKQERTGDIAGAFSRSLGLAADGHGAHRGDFGHGRLSPSAVGSLAPGCCSTWRSRA